MPPSDGDFQEYRRLIISELERNDANIAEVHKAVAEVDKKLVGIDQSIKNIDIKLGETVQANKDLELRVLGLEKDFTALKTKVMLVGGALATGVSIFVSVAAKVLLSG